MSQTFLAANTRTGRLKGFHYLTKRWEFETRLNQLAWRLAWLNAPLLSGNKWLLQRALDTYRQKISSDLSLRPRAGKRVLFETKVDLDTGKVEALQAAASGLLAATLARGSREEGEEEEQQGGELGEKAAASLQDAAALLNLFAQNF